MTILKQPQEPRRISLGSKLKNMFNMSPIPHPATNASATKENSNTPNANGTSLTVTSSEKKPTSPITTPELNPQQQRQNVNASSALDNSMGSTSALATHQTSSGSDSSHPATVATTPSNCAPRRFVELGNTHRHELKSARRQEKIGSMLRDILGGGNGKLRDDAVSAVPDLSLMSGLISQINNTSKSEDTAAAQVTSAPMLNFSQKYGKCQEVIGKGAYGTVRVAHKFDRETRVESLYAVKEFKRKNMETEAHFNKRLTSEFCIASSLRDINVIHTLDLMKDAKKDYCQVMEFCDGGDLYSLILSSDGGLKQDEADCFFKQLVSGLVYMHSMGVAHLDIKPENLLLTSNGVLKITDFGNAECFKMAWETSIHLSEGVLGSRPYIAPEQFRCEQYDPRASDIWATGIVYMAMRTGSYLWQVAIPDEDIYYEKYLRGRKDKAGFEPIEGLRRSRCRNVVYSILDPNETRRLSGMQVLNSEWVRGIQLCEAGKRGY